MAVSRLMVAIVIVMESVVGNATVAVSVIGVWFFTVNSPNSQGDTQK